MALAIDKTSVLLAIYMSSFINSRKMIEQLSYTNRSHFVAYSLYTMAEQINNHMKTRNPPDYTNKYYYFLSDNIGVQNVFGGFFIKILLNHQTEVYLFNIWIIT